MIPGDVRVLSCKDLFVSQGSLTGESLPVEKFHDPETKTEVSTSPTEIKNTCFMGTSVQSGTATAVVVSTGVHTYLGSMAGSITEAQAPTSFDRGLSGFTWLMIRLMAVMVPLVFLINGFTKHDWKSAFFFAMAVAVGLTPEMLPMIVSVCLAKGALAMSRKKVIVKRLNAIQNFGGMDVLCTDKTGTLTEDRVVLQRHCNVAGRETEEVLLDGYLISYFQTGLKNLLDVPILDSSDFHGKAVVEKHKKLDEIPFDFTRRMMSVLVEDRFQFLRAFRGGCGIRHFQFAERIQNNLGNSQASAVLIVGGNDVPWRVMGARRLQASLVSLHVMLPIFPLVNVRGAEFPVLVGLINALEESLPLLFLRKVEEYFDSSRSVAIEVALQVPDGAIPLRPDSFLVAQLFRKPLAAENLRMHPNTPS
ncbi:MAG: HAD-IC family P-type ATPase [Bryobacteraceae bacterium]